MKLLSFTRQVLETFKILEMNDSLALFLLEVADALKTVETEKDGKALMQAKRNLEDIARTLADLTPGGKYVRLFPKEKAFAKWKRLRAEKKKTPQELLALSEAEYNV